MSVEKIEGDKLAFLREELASREEQFGKSFGLEEEKFEEFKSQFDEQMSAKFEELAQDEEYKKGLIGVEQGKLSQAGEGQLTPGDYSDLLEQLIQGKLDLQAGAPKFELPGQAFNPADPFGTNPSGGDFDYFFPEGTLQQPDYQPGPGTGNLPKGPAKFFSDPEPDESYEEYKKRLQGPK